MCRLPARRVVRRARHRTPQPLPELPDQLARRRPDPGRPAGELPWPDDRDQIDVGTLTIDHAEAEALGNCRDINYDPLVLPSGIEPSDDPLLGARSATYSESFTRREGEPKTPSDVQVPAPGTGS